MNAPQPAPPAVVIDIKSIGIIGAGQMGSGIAHVAALAGFDVTLVDVDKDQVAKALDSIERNLARQASRGRITEEDTAAALERIKTGVGLKPVGDADLVIEAVTENEEVKRAILDELCPLLREDALIATNTSSISVTRLGANTDRPGRFMGMHFMNPVHRAHL